MWKVVKELLGSKKALVTVLSVAAWALGRLGYEVPVDDLLPLVAPLWLYVLGQGLADVGKERAKIAAAEIVEELPVPPGG